MVLKQKGISQKELATKLNIHYITINKYCKNIDQPRLVVLLKIANELGVDIKDLLYSSLPKT